MGEEGSGEGFGDAGCMGLGVREMGRSEGVVWERVEGTRDFRGARRGFGDGVEAMNLE